MTPTVDCPDPKRKTEAELLRQFQDDNIRLVRENLKLRSMIPKTEPHPTPIDPTLAEMFNQQTAVQSALLSVVDKEIITIEEFNSALSQATAVIDQQSAELRDGKNESSN